MNAEKSGGGGAAAGQARAEGSVPRARPPGADPGLAPARGRPAPRRSASMRSRTGRSSRGGCRHPGSPTPGRHARRLQATRGDRGEEDYLRLIAFPFASSGDLTVMDVRGLVDDRAIWAGSDSGTEVVEVGG